MAVRVALIVRLLKARRIENYLQKNNVFYVSQKKFNDLIGLGGRHLSYDFFIPAHSILIEFNGKQHEKPIDIFGGEKRFETQREHDERKRKYAKEHSIDLLEIWYYDYNNIEQILNKKLHINDIENSA